MRLSLLLLGSLLLVSIAGSATAEDLSVGIGPTGTIFVVDANPQLGPGVGGHIYLDYRWSPQVATQFSFFVTTQDGEGVSNGDNDILLFALPTVDFKYYPLSSPGKWDPYGLLGIGLFLTSEGSTGNGTTAFGIGANAGIGVDYLMTERLSLSFSSVFRSVGMINAPKGQNNGTAIFPFTLTGSIAYHF
ncbi:MAG: hypothetical protein HYV03_01030 [Deltaproteobacteria bacterium]|nr:hypothetical protein [Deltaproteobacteria bacterium]